MHIIMYVFDPNKNDIDKYMEDKWFFTTKFPNSQVHILKNVFFFSKI